MSEYKTLRRKYLDRLDEGLQENVANPAEQAGVGKFGAGVAAGVSALADFLVPEDATDVAAMAAGGPLLKAASKLRNMRKLKKMAKSKTAKEVDSPEYVPDEFEETIRKQVFDSKKNKWKDQVDD